jgi:hypothetical protein
MAYLAGEQCDRPGCGGPVAWRAVIRSGSLTVALDLYSCEGHAGYSVEEMAQTRGLTELTQNHLAHAGPGAETQWADWRKDGATPPQPVLAVCQGCDTPAYKHPAGWFRSQFPIPKNEWLVGDPLVFFCSSCGPRVVEAMKHFRFPKEI